MKSHNEAQENDVKDAFDFVINACAEQVANRGFIRRGAALRKMGGGNVGLIEFQKSTKGSSDRIIFTVNLAVICGALRQGEPPLTRASSIDAHLRERIGMLLAGRPDKWWEITSATDKAALAMEISELIAKEAVLYVEQYMHDEALVALWKSGKSPGLTQKQRMKHLAQLDAN